MVVEPPFKNALEAVAVSSTVLAAVGAAFVGFSTVDVPIDHRLVLTGVFVGFGVVAGMILGRWFGNGSVLAILTVIGPVLGFQALQLTLNYHTVRIDYDGSAVERGSFFVYPSRFATDLGLKIFLLDRPGVSVEDVSVSDAGALSYDVAVGTPRQDAVGSWSFETQIIHPQRLLVQYRLSDAAPLTIQVLKRSPVNVPILDKDYVEKTKLWFRFFGGLLCVIGVGLCWQHWRLLQRLQ